MISKEIIGHACGKSGEVAFMYKTELISNKIYTIYNNDFNIITNNKTFAIRLELSNKIILTLLPSAAQIENQTIICSGQSPHFRTGTALAQQTFWI